MNPFKRLQRYLRKKLQGWLGRPELPRLLRPQARFRERYPGYEIGIGSYGVPKVHDWQEGSTLRIGSYCSIADNVQIFLAAIIVPTGYQPTRFRHTCRKQVISKGMEVHAVMWRSVAMYGYARTVLFFRA